MLSGLISPLIKNISTFKRFKVSEMFVCAHCRSEFLRRLSDDVGLIAHWVNDYYLVDIVLIFEKRSLTLYREVYGLI